MHQHPPAAELTPGALTTTKDATAMAFAASWTLVNLPTPWRYQGKLALAKGSDGQWRCTGGPRTCTPSSAPPTPWW
ncbi:MAG: hypothetical protein LC749_20060 [Actinobacteria bacterium]|nr:hypothetical protein [Actinomycetota bacterium]